MKELIIGTNDEGQRIDKYLEKFFKAAPKSFIYKMLRKKNITCNGKKCSGNERLVAGDLIKIFMSDETIDKFKGESVNFSVKKKANLDIVYEDENIIIVNKASGMLSQKADNTTDSLNEYIIGYLLEKGEVTQESMSTFRPSVCNRLDRNTSGMVLAGKTLKGSRYLSEILRERTIDKYYYCIVNGVMTERKKIEGFLYKDEKKNKVIISDKEMENSSPIITAYEPIKNNGKITLLKVKLITGKTHQIRAHLASSGHAIIGDFKYGDLKNNSYYEKKYGCKSQLLHAGIVKFPGTTGDMLFLSGKEFRCEPGAIFKKVLEGEFDGYLE